MIGIQLRAARVAAGLTLRALEAKIGRLVSFQALHAYEMCKIIEPEEKVVLALANALGVTPDFLLGKVNDLILNDKNIVDKDS